MSLISTKVHGIFDYILAVFVISLPWLFGFNNSGYETWIPVILGSGTILYSACTSYEFGFIKMLPVKTHLMIDFISGLLLASSPWIFKFNDNIFLPHFITGILAIMVVYLSQSKSALKISGSNNSKIRKLKKIDELTLYLKY